MALAATGERAGGERWLQSAHRFAAAGGETQARVMAEVGIALGEAALAHRRGEWGVVVDRLEKLRPAIRAIGGSHAQRDLFEQMLIDAALKDGRFDLARALLAERTRERPRNAWGWKRYAKAAAGIGAADEAARAMAKASKLVDAA